MLAEYIVQVRKINARLDKYRDALPPINSIDDLKIVLRALLDGKKTVTLNGKEIELNIEKFNKHFYDLKKILNFKFLENAGDLRVKTS
ncbi:MAG: hypothetical protein ACTSXH_12195 [Promethearchaeota archaeon]